MPALLRGRLEVREGVVHPAEVPLVVKPQTALCRGPRDARKAARVLGDEHAAGVAGVQAIAELAQEVGAHAVDAAPLIALPVDDAAHGI